ncbi:MAG TPA: hypothetical protein PKJ41_20790 [Bryobacteraceae bacterium]|nr:hypothetical protein [Bryobacteraceae bacterium]HPT28088.1 hypothetical protein [Bryobacteraceae bacterium]
MREIDGASKPILIDGEGKPAGLRLGWGQGPGREEKESENDDSAHGKHYIAMRGG